MNKAEKVWIVGIALFWVSFAATFLVDYLGLIETSNMGFVETVWISWMMWTLVLGFAVAVLTRFAAKE